MSNEIYDKVLDLTGKPSFSVVAFSGSWNDLIDKPSLFDGTWVSLSGKPAFAAVATSGSFADLSNIPTTIAGFGITDAMSTSHPTNGITGTDITNWNAAFSWGNTAGLYKPLSYVPVWAEIIGNPFNITSPAADQLLKYNAVSSQWENWTPNYLTTEVDGLVTNEIQTLNIEGNTLSISDGNSITLPIQTITAIAGLIDHFSPGRLQVSYIAKQQILNSGFWWSNLSGQLWLRSWVFPVIPANENISTILLLIY